MTRKDYIKFAKLISDIADNETMAVDGGTLVVKLADLFKEDNPNFNQSKFFDACCVNVKDWKQYKEGKSKETYHEKAKDILWEYVSDSDIDEITKRLEEIEK